MILSIKQLFCHLRYNKKSTPHFPARALSRGECRVLLCCLCITINGTRTAFSLPVNRFIYAKHIATGRSVSRMTLFPPVHSPLIFRHLRTPFFTLTVLAVRPRISPSCQVAFLPVQTKCPRRTRTPLKSPFAPPRAIYYFDILSVVGKCFKSFVEGIKL